MDFAPSPAEARLREEVREFLDATLRPDDRLDDGWIIGFSREFSRSLGERGWIGSTWPRRYGGREASYLERLIVTEELLLAGSPVAAHWFGDRQIGPALLAYGSEEQRSELLPAIARGDLVFSIGMSEPNAGSDLASLRTRAVEDGDHFVVDGHKIWTTHAHRADYCYLVARTDPQAAKHRGISELLVDMQAPGVTVRPIVDMAGEHHFNEIFFEGVRVHRRFLVGEKNRGWYQIAAQLDYERSGIERLLSNWRVLAVAREHARRTGLDRDPVWRDRTAAAETRLATGRWLVYRVAWLLSRGIVPNKESALAKVYATELEQEVAELAGLTFGMQGLGGRIARALAFAPAYTIMGGTSSILRNIIALRGLGLPSA
jgi:alkylation response protein AidB-like acyl-CoA dehydrogenase